MENYQNNLNLCKKQTQSNWQLLYIFLTGGQGEKGSTGQKGRQGNPGFTGDSGTEGSAGQQGAKGQTGDRGQQGMPGTQGIDGTPSGPSGYYVVRHSQNAFIPTCPKNYKVGIVSLHRILCIKSNFLFTGSSYWFGNFYFWDETYTTMIFWTVDNHISWCCTWIAPNLLMWAPNLAIIIAAYYFCEFNKVFS